MAEKLIKEITIIPRFGRNAGKTVSSGWSIVEVDGVRIYRWESPGLKAQVEYQITDAGIVRKQIKGKLPFIYKSREVTIEKAVAGTVYDAQLAQLLALEDGIFKDMGGGAGWMVIANNPRLREKYAKYFKV